MTKRKWIEWRLQGTPIRAAVSLFRGKSRDEEKRRLSKCFRIAFLEVCKEGGMPQAPPVAGIEFTPLSELHGITNRMDNWIGIDPRRASLRRLPQSDLKKADGLGIPISKMTDYFITYFIVHELLHVKYPESGEREVKKKAYNLIARDSFVSRFRSRPKKKSIRPL